MTKNDRNLIIQNSYPQSCRETKTYQHFSAENFFIFSRLHKLPWLTLSGMETKAKAGNGIPEFRPFCMAVRFFKRSLSVEAGIRKCVFRHIRYLWKRAKPPKKEKRRANEWHRCMKPKPVIGWLVCSKFFCHYRISMSAGWRVKSNVLRFVKFKFHKKIIAYTQASMYNNYRDEYSSGESYRISGTNMRVFRCDGYY